MVDSICDSSYKAIDKFLDNIDVCFSLCLHISVDSLPKDTSVLNEMIQKNHFGKEVCCIACSTFFFYSLILLSGRNGFTEFSQRSTVSL